MIQSRSQSPDKGMSAGMASTSAALAGAITGLKPRFVKLKNTKSEIIKNGMDFAERTCGVVRGKRGNFISNSPCERWSRDHQTLFLTRERGGYRPHLVPGF